MIRPGGGKQRGHDPLATGAVPSRLPGMVTIRLSRLRPTGDRVVSDDASRFAEAIIDRLGKPVPSSAASDLSPISNGSNILGRARGPAIFLPTRIERTRKQVGPESATGSVPTRSRPVDIKLSKRLAHSCAASV
jgi:hypothetical protein